MKKRINDLLNGKFEYTPESFSVSEEKIEGRVLPGENFKGRFVISAQEGKSIQGFLYSSNVRAGFVPAMFFGGKESISFEIDTRGIQPGQAVEGEFCICTTQGERRLPYVIQVVRQSGEKITERVMTPEEFAALAREDFGKAYVLFVSREFPGILKQWDTSFQALYQGIRGQSVSYHSLEQFLVGAGLKEAVSLTLQTDHVYLAHVEETMKEEMILTKNTWGFSQLEISVEGDFLVLERPTATTEEFVGSIYSLVYLVRREKLHIGRNFGRIIIRYGCQETSFVVEVRNTGNIVSRKLAHQQKQEIIRLMSAYIDYRAKRSKEEDWISISLNNLVNYRKAGGNGIFADFYEIYLLLQKGETLEPAMLMEQLTRRKEELVIPQWKGVYLYLTALQNKDEEYVEYIRQELAQLFLENQENWILQWLMFRLNGHLIKNDTEKLDCIRRQYLCGCKSPIMYLEAYDILKKEPLMLRHLGEFEVHLLRFICREHLLDREICGQTAQLACRSQNFWPMLFQILCRCFQVFPSKNMLTAICTMLIKGHKNTREYASWYALGIQQDVRITGLYEYYVETMEEMSSKLLPQSVRMYFAYHNTLDYGRKAAIYANIIRNRSRDKETYQQYRPAMELFMEEQLLSGRINRDLALLYQVLLTKEVLDERMAQGLEKVLFTWEIVCDNPRMRHVVVIHEQFSQEQRVMLHDGRAYVRIYSPHAAVFLEDGQGKRYGEASLYQRERLLTRPLFEDYCREILPDGVGLLISDCCAKEEITVTGDNVGKFICLLGLPQIKTSYKRTVQDKLTQYYGQHPEQESLGKFLEIADDRELVKSHKKVWMELLAKEGLCDRAYQLLCVYGTENVEPGTLIRVYRFMVEQMEYQEDTMLLALCAQCFFLGVWEQEVLKYLMRYYEGPVENMKALWQAGREFELDSFELEERILAMVIFTREGMENTEDIFASYCRKAGKVKISRAYAALMSYEYFVRGKKVKKPLFEYMEQSMLGSAPTPEVCRLALFLHYSLRDKRSPGQIKWMQYFLRRYTERGMKFAFYHRLPAKLQRKCHIQDKFILEYRTDPRNDVILHYQINDGKEQSIMMQDTFEGIFTQEFILFYQDTLTWYFTLESGGKKTVTQKQTHLNKRRAQRGSTGQYDLINRLIEAEESQDAEMYREAKEQYIGQEYLVSVLFDR